jgi:exfoliative toxin A/B
MSNFIKKVPLPICGVILGTAALGNLLQSYSEGIRYVCGVLAAFFLLLFLIKLITNFSAFKQDMQNPIMASVSGTLPMSLMLLSVYVKPFIGGFAFAVWVLAVVLHVVLICYFTLKFIVKLEMPKVFASYFIVYVGIVVGAVTAPAYGMEAMGSILVLFGLATFVLFFVLITVRYVKHKNVPEPAKPLICIYGAPLSLCTVGYIQSVTPKSLTLLLIMLSLACLLYIFAIVQLIKCLKLPFYPSYASFTFPFVISATAVKQTMACVANLGSPMPWLNYLVLFETAVAVILVAYVYVRFLMFIFSSK